MISIGVIGGSGLYEMEGLKQVEEIQVETPYGDPSDTYISGVLEGTRLVFLPRHGRGHRYLPSEVNYRANIYGMKKLGVERIISVSAVGSLKEAIHPGHIVIPDQFIDRTRGSARIPSSARGLLPTPPLPTRFANACPRPCSRLPGPPVRWHIWGALTSAWKVRPSPPVPSRSCTANWAGISSA